MNFESITYHERHDTLLLLQECKLHIRHILSIYGKNDFAEVSKNLTRFRYENNFVYTIKIFI